MTALSHLRAWIAASTLIGLGGCGTPSRYQPYQENSFSGYLSDQISATTFRVTYTGRPATGKQRVEDFALLRAAEVSLDNRYPYFAVASDDVAALAGANAGAGMPHDARGGGASEEADGYRQASSALTATLIIHCFKKAPSSGERRQVRNARQVSDNLRQKYAIENSPGAAPGFVTPIMREPAPMPRP